jgi:hydrogenase/urease accessory protein HupE
VRGHHSAVVLAALAPLLLARPAFAHDETVSTSDVVVDASGVTWKVDVGVAGLTRALHLAPNLTARDLVAATPAIGAYLAAALTVSLDGHLVTPRTGGLEPGYDDPAADKLPTRALLTFRFPAAHPPARLQARVAFFAELTRQHRAVVTVRWGAGVRQLVRLGAAEIDLQARDFAPGRLAVVREFLLWGTEHIFLGYDHIAFLIALLLVAAGWGELLKIVTSFTVAHSLTLLLSALDVVRIPSRLTEVLIAASIVYVAAENLLPRRRGQRWILTFAFGLVHGLGFATELRQRLATLAGGVLLPVVSFNLGVELGQMAIVVALFPLLSAVRRAGERPRVLMVRWGSAAILLLGLGWLIERLVS